MQFIEWAYNFSHIDRETYIKETNIKVNQIAELKQGFLYNPDFFNDNIKKVDELNNYPLIMQKKESNSRKFIDNFLIKKNVLLTPKTEVVSQDLILEFTNIGFGIGFGIIELAKKNYPNLKELKINKELSKTKIYIAKNKNITLPFASKKLVEYIKK